MARLTRDELAADAGVSPGRVDELVRVGVLQPTPDGGFSTPDVARTRIIDAYEAAGIGVDLIGHALERRWITFDRIEDLYPDSGRKARRTVAEFRASLGDGGQLVAQELMSDQLEAQFFKPMREVDRTNADRLHVRDELIAHSHFHTSEQGSRCSSK